MPRYFLMAYYTVEIFLEGRKWISRHNLTEDSTIVDYTNIDQILEYLDQFSLEKLREFPI